MIDGGIAHGLSGLDLMDASKKLLPMLFFI
jgi:hypothetical protein